MPETITPTPDRVLVRLINTAPDQIGSIIIPDTTKERQICSILGVVIKVGVEAERATGLKPKDKAVILGRDMRTIFGTPYFDGNEELFLVKYEYIMARIDYETNKAHHNSHFKSTS